MNHLIVARHQEDVAWLDLITGWKPIVIQKDVDLPNEGRECSSFFFGVASIYDKLMPDDMVACVQGNPFDHCNTLLEDLSEKRHFDLLGHWQVECDLNGAPHHSGLPIREYWDDWVGGEPPERLSFVAGGQWIAPADLIRTWPIQTYQEMVGEMSRPQAPWVMERLWRYWFHDGQRIR